MTIDNWQLIHTAGNQADISGNTIKVSWSIGEVITFSNDNGNTHLMQGFQAYPNPGCTFNTSPKPTITSSQTVLCTGNSISLSISNTYTKYQWFIDDFKIVGADSSSYTPTKDGIYTVEVFDSITGCLDTSISYTLNLGNNIQPPSLTPNGFPDVSLLTSSSAPQYEWFVNGKRIVGKEEQDLNIYYNGEYHVVAIYPNKCRLLSDKFVVNSALYIPISRAALNQTDSTIEISDPEFQAYFNLAPNPADKSFKVVMQVNHDRNVEGSLVHTDGHIVKQGMLQDVSYRMKEATFIVDDLPAGMYYLKLNDGKNIRIEKVILY